jgi:hypothetical protein
MGYGEKKIIRGKWDMVIVIRCYGDIIDIMWGKQ